VDEPAFAVERRAVEPAGSLKLGPFAGQQDLVDQHVVMVPEPVVLSVGQTMVARWGPVSSLAGVVCWYSLMYLAPSDRPAAFGELARVVGPGGYLATAFKAGDSQVRRGGRGANLGVEFDVYWLSPSEMEQRLTDAGFATVFWGGRPAAEGEGSPQGYLVARRR
jgi:hypothetical protein